MRDIGIATSLCRFEPACKQACTPALQQRFRQMVKVLTTGRTRSPPALGAVLGPLPDRQSPQLCSQASDPPSDDSWLSEIKVDGYRLLASVKDGVVRLLTRNGLDWADRMQAVAAAIAGLGLRSAMLDGELVALQAKWCLQSPHAPGSAEGRAGRQPRILRL